MAVEPTTPTQIRAESFPDLGDEVMFPRMSAKKLERLAELGTRRSFATDETLYEQGQRDAPFLVIERGRVRVLDRKPGKDVWVAEADAGTFLGDIATFTGEPAIAECVADEPTDVISFERSELRAMLAAWPELADLVLRTMMARRQWHEANGHGVARLIAPRGSRRAFDVRDLLERNLIPVRWYDVDTDPESGAMLDWLQIPREETPVLVRNRSVLRNPSAAQVARELGLRAEIDGERFDLVVLGGGPAGLAAAVYGGSEGLRTLVTEAWAPGGQAGTSTRIENYLGFPTGITGIELTRKATLQARRFDAILSSFHRAVELARGDEGLIRVDLDDGQHALARTVVVATGRALARARGRQRRAVHRRRRLPRRHGERRGALPRRGRDRGRRRQLGRPGGGAPVAHGAQRPHRHPGRRPGRDDVALPRRAHRGAPRTSRSPRRPRSAPSTATAGSSTRTCATARTARSSASRSRPSS